MASSDCIIVRWQTVTESGNNTCEQRFPWDVDGEAAAIHHADQVGGHVYYAALLPD